jgi:hypothetical protein
MVWAVIPRMRPAFASPLSPHSPPPVARLGAALAASALAHWMLLSTLPEGSPRQRRASFPGPVPLTVRLAPMRIPAPEAPHSSIPEMPRVPALRKSPAGRAEHVPGGNIVSGAAQSAVETPALPPPPDSRYYPARDLDTYPRPLTPLRIEQPLGSSAGEIRLELLIDEHGVVRDVTFSSSTDPSGVHESLRGALMATVFIPAIKDGRAVKSRIVLGFGYPTASER